MLSSVLSKTRIAVTCCKKNTFFKNHTCITYSLSTMTSVKDTPILVTGGSGFLGSWCVHTLLERGYTVHTTVRSAEKAEFLRKLTGADTRLKIFSGVDLLNSGSYEEAMTGCLSVMHTASPFYFEGGSEESLVVPAVEGTRNVLSTCAKLGVKKVVLTSSMASIYMHFGHKPEGHVFTEADWTVPDVARENKNWYVLSKVQAELTAWEMSKEPNCPYKLTTINPSLILGPQLPNQPHLNTSTAFVVKYFDGSMKQVENTYRSVVDVRDVAEAHVRALESDSDDVWGKRFVIVAASPHVSECYEATRRCVPDELKANVPTEMSTDPVPVGARLVCDASASERALGIQYRGVDEMVAAAVKSCLENGFTDKTMYNPKKL